MMDTQVHPLEYALVQFWHWALTPEMWVREVCDSQAPAGRAVLHTAQVL
jgi:hypothetical protein